MSRRGNLRYTLLQASCCRRHRHRQLLLLGRGCHLRRKIHFVWRIILEARGAHLACSLRHMLRLHRGSRTLRNLSCMRFRPYILFRDGLKAVVLHGLHRASFCLLVVILVKWHQVSAVFFPEPVVIT